MGNNSRFARCKHFKGHSLPDVMMIEHVNVGQRSPDFVWSI